MNDELVLYCIVSEEAVKASCGARGKMASQAGHAFVGAFMNASVLEGGRHLDYHLSPARPKVTLIATQDQIMQLYDTYKDKVGLHLVTDAGRTVFKEPMITALGLGPIRKSERDDLLRGLSPWQ